jgi:uncharacterized protein (TIGR03437 family)
MYFTYCATPTVTAPTTAAPATGPAEGGNAISITGTDLAGTTSVAIDGVPSPFVVISPTEVDTIVPAGTGTVDIAVTTCGGATTVTGGYVYVTAP